MRPRQYLGPLALAAALAAAPIEGQQGTTPTVVPPESPEEAPAAPPPTARELLPGLFGDTVDPFASRSALQARRLRGLTAEVAALVLRGEEGGGLGVAALAVPLPEVAPSEPPPRAAGEETPAGPRVPVSLFVEIDGASFLEANRTDVARVELYAYVLTATGGVAGHLEEAFAVDVGALGEAVWEAGLRFHGRLELPPGDYDLRVLVRNAQSNAAGLAASPVTVPPPGGAPTPLFATPADRDSWIPVRSWGGGPGAEAPRYPFVAGEQAVHPAALPVLVAGRPAEALLFGTGGDRPARVVLTPAEGKGSYEAAVTPAGGGEGPRTVRFTTPDIPSGEYRLAVAGALDAASNPAVPVLVMAGDAAGRALLWTDLRWRVSPQLAQSGGAAAAVVESSEKGARGRGRRGGRGARKMAAAYREALTPLTTGEGGWDAARSALFELQSATLAGDHRGSLSQLQAGVRSLAEELAKDSPEALPPLIVLHESLYRDYRRRRVFSLASFNRLMVESLAELYASSGGSPELAALALVSLGGYLQEANLPATSSRLFRRALALDPESRAAHLALGSLHERLGDPRGAVEQLGPALRAEPNDAEARLRLAVNLGRGGGDRRRSEELLEEVTAGDGPSWVRAIAYQELARRELAIGNAETAARRLETAVQQLPDDRGLHLLLAVAYDRLRQPREALDALTRVGAGGGESPRKRYDDWPQGAIDGARSRLESGAHERRAELARALDGGRG